MQYASNLEKRYFNAWFRIWGMSLTSLTCQSGSRNLYFTTCYLPHCNRFGMRIFCVDFAAAFAEHVLLWKLNAEFTIYLWRTLFIIIIFALTNNVLTKWSLFLSEKTTKRKRDEEFSVLINEAGHGKWTNLYRRVFVTLSNLLRCYLYQWILKFIKDLRNSFDKCNFDQYSIFYYVYILLKYQRILS